MSTLDKISWYIALIALGVVTIFDTWDGMTIVKMWFSFKVVEWTYKLILQIKEKQNEKNLNQP